MLIKFARKRLITSELGGLFRWPARIYRDLAAPAAVLIKVCSQVTSTGVCYFGRLGK